MAEGASRDQAGRGVVLATQLALLVASFLAWWALVALKILPVFFFGDPVKVLQRLFAWFVTGTIWIHLGNTLIETILSFAIGTVLGLVSGCGSRSHLSGRACSIPSSRRRTPCRA
jgi:NitT/TauT family transport system permease protein